MTTVEKLNEVDVMIKSTEEILSNLLKRDDVNKTIVQKIIASEREELERLSKLREEIENDSYVDASQDKAELKAEIDAMLETDPSNVDELAKMFVKFIN